MPKDIPWLAIVFVFFFVLGAGCTCTGTGCPNPTPNPSATPLHGLCFSPYVDDQSPGNPAQIPRSQITERLGIVAPYTTWIRTYGCDGGLEEIPALAKSLNKSTAVGVWLGPDDAANQRQIGTLLALAKNGSVDIAVIGNEAVYGGHLTAANLTGYLRAGRSQVPGVNVTTAEPLSIWKDHPELVDEVDVIFVNLYPFWNGIPIDNAIANIDGEYHVMTGLAKGKKVVIAETGWPSAGNPNRQVVPSLENARRYYREFTSWADNNSVDYFYFEAFDEDWKGAGPEDVEGHWGLWDSSGNLKFPLR